MGRGPFALVQLDCEPSCFHIKTKEDFVFCEMTWIPLQIPDEWRQRNEIYRVSVLLAIGHQMVSGSSSTSS